MKIKTSLEQKQELAIKRSSEEIAKLVVQATEHEPTKTSMYINEYASLLEKYNTACVVRISADELAQEEKDDLINHVR